MKALALLTAYLPVFPPQIEWKSCSAHSRLIQRFFFISLSVMAILLSASCSRENSDSIQSQIKSQIEISNIKNDKAKSLRMEMAKIYPTLDNTPPPEASLVFQKIIDRYVQPGMPFREAIKLLNDAGFTAEIINKGRAQKEYLHSQESQSGDLVICYFSLGSNYVSRTDMSVRLIPPKSGVLDKIDKVLTVYSISIS